MSMDWFRVWNEMPNDPKWRTIARKSQQPIALVIAVYIHMLTQASIAEDRGHITGWKDDDIASALDVETEQVEAIRQAMQGKVLDGDLIAGWHKRQPQREDASSTARVKAFRERKKCDETRGNAVKRDETHGNAPDTDTDTDTDTEAETESVKQEAVVGKKGVGARNAPDATAQPTTKPQSAPTKAATLPEIPDWLPANTWQAFIDYRKAKRKPLTPQAAALTLRDLDKARAFGHDPVALIETAIANGWTGCVFRDRHFQPPPPANGPAVPGGGRAPVRAVSPLTPEAAEFDAILQNLHRPVLDGEVLNARH